jgi:hypothetical protein
MNGYVPLTSATPAFSHEAVSRSMTLLDIDDRQQAQIPHSRLSTGYHALCDFAYTNAGLLLIIMSQAFFAFMNVSVKFLNGLEPPVPPLELIVIRMVSSFYCGNFFLINPNHDRLSRMHVALLGCTFDYLYLNIRDTYCDWTKVLVWCARTFSWSQKRKNAPRHAWFLWVCGFSDPINT